MFTNHDTTAEAHRDTADLRRREVRKDLLRDLGQMSNDPMARFLGRYILTLVPVAAAAGVLAWTPQLLTAVLFAVIAGFTQNALGLLMHEGSHHFFHGDKDMNDVLANLLVCYPIFNTMQSYRREHFEHHRHSGHERDPFYDLYANYPRRADVIKGLAADSIGLTAVKTFMKRHATNARREGREWISMAFLLTEQALIAGLLWWLTGSPLAYPLLWLLPLMTIPIAINRMRTIVEHYPGFEPLPANRTTVVSIVEYLCVAPYGYSHHFEHHFAPNVPYYRLAWAHGYLKDRGVTLRSCEYAEHGYLRTFARLMRELGARPTVHQ